MLPPFRKAVKIKFWSRRDGIVEGLGVMPDLATQVMRECYREKDGKSWQWKIKNYRRIENWDWGVLTDQEMLNEKGADLEYELVKNPDEGKEN